MRNEYSDTAGDVPYADEIDYYCDLEELSEIYEDPFEDIDNDTLLSICGMYDEPEWLDSDDGDYYLSQMFERTVVSDQELETTDWKFRVRPAYSGNRREWSSSDEEHQRFYPTPTYSAKPVAEQSTDEWLQDHNAHTKYSEMNPITFRRNKRT